MEVNLTEVDPLNTKLSFSQLLGIVILFSITAITLVLIATVSIFCYKQHKIRDSFKVEWVYFAGIKIVKIAIILPN